MLVHVDQSPRRIGVALSGGGSRAAGWALGAVYGLCVALEAERPKQIDHQVVSVSSVSGGSLTNAAVAATVHDLAAETPAELRAATVGLVDVLAHRGIVFPGGTWRARTYVATLLSSAGLLGVVALLLIGMRIGRAWSVDDDRVVLAAVVLSVVVGAWSAWATWKKRRALAHPEVGGAGRLRRVVVGVVRMAAVPWIVAVGIFARHDRWDWWPSWGHRACWWAVAGLAVLLLVLASQRGRIVRVEIDQMLQGRTFGQTAGATTHHVFCPAELQAGRHLYITNRLVTGAGQSMAPIAASVKVALAAQASAALPAAFPPVVLKPRDLGLKQRKPTDRVVLVDGGVYDNMAEEWELSWPARSALTRAAQPAADLLIVANSGGALRDGWKRSWWPKIELLGLARDQSIQYNATTAQRRRLLIRVFELAEVTNIGPVGVIAHIQTLPREIATTFANATAGDEIAIVAPTSWMDRKARALRIMPKLDELDQHTDWTALVDRNQRVPTTLTYLTTQTLGDLVHHSAVLVQTALYVVHGIGGVGDGPPDLVGRQHVTDWLQGTLDKEAT